MPLLSSQTGKIGNILLKNRFVRSATMEAMADEGGFASEGHVNLYRALAEGGTGLIITGHTWVQKNGQAGPHQMGIDDDKYIPGLAKIADVVHTYGQGARTFLQLTHCGRQTGFQKDPVSPSPVPDTFTHRLPRAMSLQEIEDTIKAFVQGARRAQAAGFDGVQIHAAHGWLLSGFLSPHTNHRTDIYGGNTENRCRMLEEILDGIHTQIGRQFPVLVKINVDDFLVDGINTKEALSIAIRLAQKGCAGIETSGGMWECLTRSEKELGWKPVMIPEARVNIKTRESEAYFRTAAAVIKKSLNIPVILVGGIRSIDTIEEVLKLNEADFVSLSRPLIRQPDLPKLWLEGKKTSADCISCNACLRSLREGGLCCLQAAPGA